MPILKPSSYTNQGNASIANPALAWDGSTSTESYQDSAAVGNSSGLIGGFQAGAAAACTITINARAYLSQAAFTKPVLTVCVSGSAVKTWNVVDSYTNFSYTLGTVDPSTVTVLVTTHYNGTDYNGVKVVEVSLDYAGDSTLASTSARLLGSTAALRASSSLASASSRLLVGQGAVVAPSRLASSASRTLTATGTLVAGGLSSVASRLVAASGALSAPVRLASLAPRLMAASDGFRTLCLLAGVAARAVTTSGAITIDPYYRPNPTLQGRKIARDLQIPWQGDKVS